LIALEYLAYFSVVAVVYISKASIPQPFSHIAHVFEILRKIAPLQLVASNSIWINTGAVLQ